MSDSDFKEAITFILNEPAAYKVRLQEKINSRQKVKSIYLAQGSENRNEDFHLRTNSIHTNFLSNKKFTKRSLAKNILNLIYIIIGDKNRIILGGWEFIEYWVPLFLGKRYDVIIESSILEYKKSFVKDLIKKIFLLRVNTVYVPGEPHERLIRHLKFNGEIVRINGVGIPGISKKYNHQRMNQYKSSQIFGYIGRVEIEKNIEIIIEAAKKLPMIKFEIIGDGSLLRFYKEIAPDNIVFLGYIINQEIEKYLDNWDGLILSSVSETWGLVAEEALLRGVPVLISTSCGCAEYYTNHKKFGLHFSPKNYNELIDSILILTDPMVYKNITNNINSYDWTAHYQTMANKFIK